MDLRGRVSIVTGGSKGIGASIAEHLANNGADVVICSRSVKNEWMQYNEIPHENGRIYSIRADVTSSEDIKNVIDMTISHLGHLDILVNNAGGPIRQGGFFELLDEEWRNAFEFNAISMIKFVRETYPYLKDSQFARIITISSLTAIQTGSYNPHYSITKAAILNLNKHLATLFAKDKILVNAICPGPIHSNSWNENVSRIASNRNISYQEAWQQIEHEESQKVALGRIGEGSDVAFLVAFLASDKASWITGSCFIVDGGKHCSIF